MDRLLEATAHAELDHFWFRGFRRFVGPLLEGAVKGHPAPRILDCGCGTGFNLAMLRTHGAAVGIDLTWTGLAVAHTRGERAVAQASAADLPFRDASFDLVTSFDVLQTIPDGPEMAAFTEMHRVLRPGGHLLVNVAALALLRGNHSVLSHEVRRYSRAMLRERLERTGFTIRRLTYTNASILPVTLAVRLMQRLSGHQESSHEISTPAAPVNRALSALLAAEAAAVRAVDMPFGSSLLALAAKRT